MYYKLFIGNEDGTARANNLSVQGLARSTTELLESITQCANFDDVVQVEIIEEITVLDGFGPQLARVGSFASYYNGPTHSEFMERFHCTGQGLALYEELCRLAKEQARKTA